MQAHNIEFRVFCMPEDDYEEVYESFVSFLPENFEKERIVIEKSEATGFNNKKIIVLQYMLQKQRHVNCFLANLNSKLSKNQKYGIVNNAKNRVDEDFCLFLRFDKSALVKDKTLALTDSGECFHCKISLAVFPRKRYRIKDALSSVFQINNKRS
jgi:RNA binding exosome subunit